MKQLILLLALLCPVSLLADFQAGLDAMSRGDYATAYREVLSVAEKGHSEAQSTLGFMYSYGLGVPQDCAKALKWYRLAAEQGDVVAQYDLGLMYLKGKGVPQDDVQAYAWLNLVVALGYKEAETNRGVAQKRMTPAQVAEGQKLSRELFERVKK